MEFADASRCSKVSLVCHPPDRRLARRRVRARADAAGATCLRGRGRRDAGSAHRRLLGRDQGGTRQERQAFGGLQQSRRRLPAHQAIKLKPSAEAHFNRGNAYLGKSQHASAIDDFNQAIKLKADFAQAFDNRCWARAVVGILKQALADCNEALRLMPSNAATLDSRAFVFLKMTNFDAAVSDYDAALRIDPKLAFALYGRGLARLKNEDAAGESDIAAAKALQADIAEEYARYGMQDTR